MLNLNTARINSLLASEEAFPIDLDEAYKWIGYTRKDSAVDTLKSNFEEGIDFSGLNRKSPQGGRPGHSYQLTIDAFKCLAMMANTEKGKEVRQYFLECERELKAITEAGTEVALMAIGYKALGHLHQAQAEACILARLTPYPSHRRTTPEDLAISSTQERIFHELEAAKGDLETIVGNIDPSTTVRIPSQLPKLKTMPREERL
jgi:phage anti-repressor protein